MNDRLKDIIAFFVLAIVAVMVNAAPYFLTGIPLKYNQSSDTLVHLVHWQEAASDYAGNFEADEMFQQNQGWPTGQLFVNKVLVRIAEMLNIDFLSWSIFISWCSLALFLSGVYALVFYTLRSRLLAFLISLVSIVPVISLGLSSWGFFVRGFVPKELAVAITVWLTILYFSGVLSGSKKKIAWFFVSLGFFSNWYPIVFFHYALLMMIVEVVRAKAIRKEHFFYGVIFLAAAPVALYDLFAKIGGFSPPDLSLIYAHYTWPLHSLEYLFAHYLRKQFVYAALIGGLWYLYRKLLKKEYPSAFSVWYAMWWASLGLSLVGVGIELFAPAYMKFLLPRVSVWFYFVSMVIVAYSAYEIYAIKFSVTRLKSVLFSFGLIVVLLGQTSVISAYKGVFNFNKNAEDYRDYIAAIDALNEHAPLKTILLVYPDRQASGIRAYGGYGVYVSSKDGNVTLVDGEAARKWKARYDETVAVFATKDYAKIKKFAINHGLTHLFYDIRDIETKGDLERATFIRFGNYGLAELK